MSHPMYSNLCSIASLFCLTQVVSGPTHKHHNGSTSTIDLIFLSEPTSLQICETIPPLSSSDHMGISLKMKRKPSRAEQTKGRLIWRYSYADWDKACELINAFDWDSLLSQNIELSWELWQQRFILIMKEAIPSNRIRTRRNLPWLNKSIVKSMRERNRLFKKAKRTGDFSHYKLARNRTDSAEAC